MPKALLTFNLPEEQAEYDRVMKAVEDIELYQSAYIRYDGWLRNLLKHQTDGMTDAEQLAFQKCRDQFTLEFAICPNPL